jgi:CBS domain-containing protein
MAVLLARFVSKRRSSTRAVRRLHSRANLARHLEDNAACSRYHRECVAWPLHGWSNMKIDQIMTRDVITIPRDAYTSLAELEMKLSQVRHLLVTDREQRLVGVVSQRDLVRTSERVHRTQLRIDEIMHGVPITTRPDGDAAEAAALLINKKIGCLPVVDEFERIVGIVTETDFVNVAYQALSGLPLHERGTPA